MRRFFSNISLKTYTTLNKSNANILVINQSHKAKELFKKGLYKKSAEEYTKLRRFPDFSPEQYVAEVQYLLNAYALTDTDALRSLYLSDPHKEFYKKHITVQTKNTALHLALLVRQNDIAKLVASKDTIRLCNICGYSPIDMAFQSGNFDFLHFVKETFDLSHKPLLSEVTMSIINTEPYVDEHYISLVEDFFDTSNHPSRANTGSCNR